MKIHATESALEPATEAAIKHWWTGKAPPDCPGYDPQGFLRALPQLEFQGIHRQNLLDYFDNGWTLTELLFSALQSEEAFTTAPKHGLRHPLIFYYGHPAVLYVNKLRVAGLVKDPIDEYLEKILDVGVDEMSWDDMSKNEMRWPLVSEIQDYRRKVYNLVKDLILNDPRLDPKQVSFSQSSPAWALVMGFEHERIHLETSSVLLRELPLHFMRRPEAWPLNDKTVYEAPLEELIQVKETTVEVGKPLNYPSFGWDNEYGHRRITVPALELGRHLLSNAQFLEFVNAGGYRNLKYWSTEGWAWRSYRNTKAPCFWEPLGPGGLHQYKIRTIFEVVDFRPDWPAVVNFHEAEAYCAWRTEHDDSSIPYRLPSEAEIQSLRSLVPKKGKWNLDLVSGSECSAFCFSSEGVFDLYGNLWQWCEDHFNPLPGFQMHPYYEDFSSPCFDGRHQMILGGSFASTGDETSPFARFHFRPHFHQHAGFRIARSLSQESASTAIHLNIEKLSQPASYESLELLSQYLLLHFGEASESLFDFKEAPFSALGFPQRCADKLLAATKRLGLQLDSVLDIGCAVGGSSFQLSEHFKTVVGVDLSSSFISTAELLRSRSEVTYLRKDQGELTTKLIARLPKNSRPERVRFLEGDACDLPKELINFDAVLMANLLCRLPDPRACLEAMGGARSVVKPGGLLVLVSPYSWLEQHTNPASWLGGRIIKGSAISSADEIKNILRHEFRLIEVDNLPLIIREHERKYQFIISHLMIWQRRT